MLALSVGEEDRGKIYLCETEHWDDIEQDAEGTLSEKNIHQVADSFAEFLASLTGEVGHSMAPYELIEAGDLEGLRSWLDGDGQKMSRNPTEMMSLLNAAFLVNHTEIAVLLIERGASVVQVFNLVMRS